nr:ROK family protein [Flexivirga aerilata]
MAVDVGGTTIKSAVVDGDGKRRLAHAVPTPVADGPAAVVETLRRLVSAQATAARAAGEPVTAVGVVVPGVVDTSRGIARYAANIGWRDVPLRDLVRTDVALPVAVGHDVRAAGLAELALGAAGDSADALIVVVGTGIAGVVVAGGTVVEGHAGIAGEIGHIPVGDLEVRCNCGAFGCLEMFSSARAVSRMYAERTGTTLAADQIVARLGEDADAREVWRSATATLARGLVCAALLTDPQRVVLAGGLSAAGETLREPVAAAFAAGMPWREAPELVVSELAGAAGLVGAALLARDAAEEGPA